MNLVNEHLWVVYQSVASKKVEIREAICLWNDRNFRVPDPNWSITKFGDIAFHFIDSEDVIVTKDVCKEYMWRNFYPESPFYAFFLTKEEADDFYDKIQVKKLSKIVDSKRFTIGDTYYAVQFSFKDGYYVHKTRITGFSNKQHYIGTSIGLIKIKSLYKSFTTAKREAKRKNKRRLEEISNEYAKYILEHKVAKPVKKLEIGESYYMINSRKTMKPIFVSSNGLSAIMDNGKYFSIRLENNVLYSTVYEILIKSMILLHFTSCFNLPQLFSAFISESVIHCWIVHKRKFGSTATYYFFLPNEKLLSSLFFHPLKGY